MLRNSFIFGSASNLPNPLLAKRCHVDICLTLWSRLILKIIIFSITRDPNTRDLAEVADKKYFEENSSVTPRALLASFVFATKNSRSKHSLILA